VVEEGLLVKQLHQQSIHRDNHTVTKSVGGNYLDPASNFFGVEIEKHEMTPDWRHPSNLYKSLGVLPKLKKSSTVPTAVKVGVWVFFMHDRQKNHQINCGRE